MLIRIVDDDTDHTDSLIFLLESEGWDAVGYPSAEDFLTKDATSVEGCLILDIRMNGLNGIELQEEMKRRSINLPIIFLTGHGDVEMAVQAMKFGAKDFLQKPIKPEKLIQAISKITTEQKEKKDFGNSLQYWEDKLSLLTKRERDVIELSAVGLLNQDIAERLNISKRTVHTHRLNSYKKLGLHSLSELAPITELLRRKETKKIPDSKHFIEKNQLA